MTGTRLGQVPIVASWMQYGVDLRGSSRCAGRPAVPTCSCRSAPAS